MTYPGGGAVNRSQAKGILMANERCDPQRAFDILRQASQHQNCKLRDVAEELVGGGIWT